MISRKTPSRLNLSFWAGLSLSGTDKAISPAIRPLQFFSRLFLPPLIYMYSAALVLGSLLSWRKTGRDPYIRKLVDFSHRDLAENPGRTFQTSLPRALLWDAFQRACDELAAPIVELGALDARCSSFLLNGRKCDVYSDIFIQQELLDRVGTDPSSKIVFADARNLPFPSESVGTLIFISGIWYASPRRKVLSEAFRVLRPGGRFVFTDAGMAVCLLRGPLSAITHYLRGKRVSAHRLSYQACQVHWRREGRHITGLPDSWYYRYAKKVGFEIEKVRGYLSAPLGLLLSPFSNSFFRSTDFYPHGNRIVQDTMKSRSFSRLGQLCARYFVSAALLREVSAAERGLEERKSACTANLWIFRKPSQGQVPQADQPAPHRWVCPVCGTALTADGENLDCGNCRASFPVVADVPILLPSAASDAEITRDLEISFRYKVGSYSESRGDFDQAASLFEKVIRTYPSTTLGQHFLYGSYFHLARMGIQKGRVAEARNHLGSVLKLCPAHQEARRLLAGLS